MEEINMSSQAWWHPRGHGGLKTGGWQQAGWAACTVSPAPKASRCESPVAPWRPGGQGGRLDRGSTGGRTWARGLLRSGPVRFPEELIATSGSPVVWRSSREPIRCSPQESRPLIACQEILTDLGSKSLKGEVFASLALSNPFSLHLGGARRWGWRRKKLRGPAGGPPACVGC